MKRTVASPDSDTVKKPRNSQPKFIEVQPKIKKQAKTLAVSSSKRPFSVKCVPPAPQKASLSVENELGNLVYSSTSTNLITEDERYACLIKLEIRMLDQSTWCFPDFDRNNLVPYFV